MMFCKSRFVPSFSVVSNAAVCEVSSMISNRARAFKSLASTNFAMPARLVLARFSALTPANVLQFVPRVLQNGGRA